MLHFKVLVLICAAGLDRSACDERTALDVVRGHWQRGGGVSCGLMAQGMVAPTAIAPGPGRYPKIVCRVVRDDGIGG